MSSVISYLLFAAEEIESNCRIDNGGCEQVCHERHGGHYCSCHAGYNLGPDGVNCTGRGTLSHPSVISLYMKYRNTSDL